jgi:hypothetical protein
MPTDPDMFSVNITFPERAEPSTFQIPLNFGANTSLTLYPSGTTFSGSSGACAKVSPDCNRCSSKCMESTDAAAAARAQQATRVCW